MVDRERMVELAIEHASEDGRVFDFAFTEQELVAYTEAVLREAADMGVASCIQ